MVEGRRSGFESVTAIARTSRRGMWRAIVAGGAVASRTVMNLPIQDSHESAGTARPRATTFPHHRSSSLRGVIVPSRLRLAALLHFCISANLFA
jgi:hypothetical protein